MVALILLHYLTCGLFSFIWVGLQHGKLPRVRTDDPSTGKAIGFCFIPFFNLYWIFFATRRLCRRIDEQRRFYGLAPSNLTGLATITCIFQVIPYINLFLGYAINNPGLIKLLQLINLLLGYGVIYPIFIGLLQRSINQLATQTAQTGSQAISGTQTSSRKMPVWAIILIICAALVMPGILAGLFIPAFVAARQRTQALVCVNHERQLMHALRTYTAANNSRFPKLSEGWCDVIKQYAGDDDSVFECPATAGSIRCGYAINRQLAGADWRRVNPTTVVLFESDQGWNASGDKDLLPAKLHHRVLVVGFADGSVQMIQPSQISLLRWNP